MLIVLRAEQRIHESSRNGISMDGQLSADASFMRLKSSLSASLTWGRSEVSMGEAFGPSVPDRAQKMPRSDGEMWSDEFMDYPGRWMRATTLHSGDWNSSWLHCLEWISIEKCATTQGAAGFPSNLSNRGENFHSEHQITCWAFTSKIMSSLYGTRARRVFTSFSFAVAQCWCISAESFVVVFGSGDVSSWSSRNDARFLALLRFPIRRSEALHYAWKHTTCAKHSESFLI